ncbi:hypothetical protein [Natronorubrum aibiense]|uniref:hypothetical protein n=1 Tax=Natronorubrum aibiense TaxID=348826 RepID=UPI00128EAD15|nr:hypothetical protein [Natronorubrum aibiense]
MLPSTMVNVQAAIRSTEWGCSRSGDGLEQRDSSDTGQGGITRRPGREQSERRWSDG